MLRLSARRRRLAIKLGSVLVLLLAVLPQVLYLGHPLKSNVSSSVARAVPAGHQHHDAAAAQHAGHCHVGPKGCAAADGAVTVASLATAIQVLEDGQTAISVDNAPLLRGFALWQRPEKPPQAI
jgi:hypothetical protein